MLSILIGCFPHQEVLAQYPNAEEAIFKPIRYFADSLFARRETIFSAERMRATIREKGQLFVQSADVKVGKGAKLRAPSLYKKGILGVGLVAMCTKSNPLRAVNINPASAFKISSDGLWVTNYHVLHAFAQSAEVQGPSAFLIRTADGDILPLKAVLGFSAQDDIAIIKVETKVKTSGVLPLAESDPMIGDNVFVLGNPQNLSYSMTNGIVSNKYSDRIGLPGERSGVLRNLLSITAEFAIGASGSPVLNERGHVIGIVSSTQVIEQNNIGRPQSQMVIRNVIPVSSLKKLLNIESN